ncbi:hypothetical protein HMI55_001288 [Coelomomyces lativittatus]|nr:hypothetical protein HMI55_001288 [Coelomomyces lativittatus]
MTQTTDLFQFLKQCGVENLDVWFHPLDHAQPLAHLMNDSKVFQQVVRTIRKVSRNNPS